MHRLPGSVLRAQLRPERLDQRLLRVADHGLQQQVEQQRVAPHGRAETEQVARVLYRVRLQNVLEGEQFRQSDRRQLHDRRWRRATHAQTAMSQMARKRLAASE